MSWGWRILLHSRDFIFRLFLLLASWAFKFLVFSITIDQFWAYIAGASDYYFGTNIRGVSYFKGLGLSYQASYLW